MSTAGAFADWLHAELAAIRAHLYQTGGVLFRGFASELAEAAFPILLDAIGTPMADYLGGSTPRKQLGSRTYTATELGGEYSIALHQEMSYLADSPEGIAFYCQRPAAAGGRTLLADARRLGSMLPDDLVASLTSARISIVRALPTQGSAYLAAGISRPWQDVFRTDDRSVVIEIAATRGWSVAWHDDGTLRLGHVDLPVYRDHPVTGETLWFNQAHYYSAECMVRWAERDGRSAQKRLLQHLIARKEPRHLNAVRTAQDAPVPADTLLAIWDALISVECPVEMREGDILLLDNYRVMHGRERYGGARTMQAGLIDSITR